MHLDGAFSMKNSKASGTRLSGSMLAGLFLVPAAAVVAVVLITPAAQGEDYFPEMTVPRAIAATTSQPRDQAVILEPVSASEADLVAACGTDGMLLVDLEKSGEATDIQQAALDALRQLCDEVGLPLPSPPSPPPIVKTVVSEGPTGSSSSEEDDSDEHHGEEYEHEDDDEDEDDEEDEDEHKGSEADYLSAHASATAAIEKAVAEGGDAEDIQEAREKLAEAEQEAAKHDWNEATEKAYDAKRRAFGSHEDD